MRRCADPVAGTGRLYVCDLHGQLVGVDLAADVARDPALHLRLLHVLGRQLQRRADDVTHAWLALTLVAELWLARGTGPPEDYEPHLGCETSPLFRAVRWLVERSSDAASWWTRLEDALGDGPPLVEGQPDGRWDLFWCGSCGEVVNAEARGRRWCLACESGVERVAHTE